MTVRPFKCQWSSIDLMTADKQERRLEKKIGVHDLGVCAKIDTRRIAR